MSWDGDKLLCVQRGEKQGRGWTHWLEEDKLHLVRKCGWLCEEAATREGDRDGGGSETRGKKLKGGKDACVDMVNVMQIR